MRPVFRHVPFDAMRAMGHLEAICAIGPRISGTEGMRKQQELIENHFKDLGAEVEYQRFTFRQASCRQPTDLANMIVSWHPARTRRVILGSHYDTRPIADREDDPRDWHKPFVSANDGGSGVALLLELGRHMRDLPTKVGVDFVFFDGEEYILDPRTDYYFLGSVYFARQYQTGAMRPKYGAAILLDMIAGKDVHFPMEGYSARAAAPLVESVWRVARELKVEAFAHERGPDVYDDHLPLNNVGIPAIDIIDLKTTGHAVINYPHWHKLSDTPDHCSGESMAQVARVLSVWLQRAGRERRAGSAR